MNKKAQKALIFAGVALALTACGDEVTNVTENNVGVQSFETLKDFPDCTAETLGEMAVSIKEGKVYYCIDSTWQTLNGKDGKNGVDGEDGAAGKDGVDGAKGDKGDSGTNGDNGTSCSLVDNVDGTVTVKCGSKSAELTKAMCGTTPYDPKKQICDDRNGTKQLYKIVTIGEQTWMAENLNYKVENSYCYYAENHQVLSDSLANCAKYGRLYTWAAAMGKSEEECGYNRICNVTTFPHQGVCPDGWHLPSDAEFEKLLAYIAEDQGLENQTLSNNEVGKFLKATEEWIESPEVENKDTYGFSALPAGYSELKYADEFSLAYRNTYFWSAKENSDEEAVSFGLANDSDNLFFYNDYKYYGASIRCVKDSE